MHSDSPPAAAIADSGKTQEAAEALYVSEVADSSLAQQADRLPLEGNIADSLLVEAVERLAQEAAEELVVSDADSSLGKAMKNAESKVEEMIVASAVLIEVEGVFQTAKKALEGLHMLDSDHPMDVPAPAA